MRDANRATGRRNTLSSQSSKLVNTKWYRGNHLLNGYQRRAKVALPSYMTMLTQKRPLG